MELNGIALTQNLSKPSLPKEKINKRKQKSHTLYQNCKNKSVLQEKVYAELNDFVMKPASRIGKDNLTNLFMQKKGKDYHLNGSVYFVLKQIMPLPEESFEAGQLTSAGISIFL